MNLKSGIAKAAGKSSYWFLHNVLKGGTSFPGKFAMKIDPEVLNSLAKGYETIIVTGSIEEKIWRYFNQSIWLKYGARNCYSIFSSQK